MDSLFGAVVSSKATPAITTFFRLHPPFHHPQQKAYDHNLRGTYLFINVPPIDRAPAWLGNARAPFYKQNITEYNAALAAHTAAFAKDHKDVNVLTFDANAWFEKILDNAATYGLKNTTGQVSVNRQTCVC